VAFTGSTEVGRKIREATAGQNKELTLELGGKSPYIVFDDADLDSAVEGLVDAIWFNQGQVCCAGSRLFVQEGVADTFHKKLKARMDKLRVGNPMDKSVDLGAIVDPKQLESISQNVEEGLKEGGKHYVSACELPEKRLFLSTHLDHRSGSSLSIDAGGNFWTRASRDYFSYARRSGGLGQ
jgi:aldehyde dehydrogenase (NAD+)